jgi:hypothetical protein
MGGNMFVYYSTELARQILAEEAEPARPHRAFRGPDLFVVLHVDGSFRRQKWVVWDEEGRYPDVIFEFLSPSTRRTDQTTKKTLYEQTFRTREYYWYDPFDPREFQGWQLHSDSGYQAMAPDARGWIWSPVLHLWIGRWEGTYPRSDHLVAFYDPQGLLVLTSQEIAEGSSNGPGRSSGLRRRAASRGRRSSEPPPGAELARLPAELRVTGELGLPRTELAR